MSSPPCKVSWILENEKFLLVESGVLAPVVQKLDSAIHQINLYPVDKYYQWKPINCTIHWIVIYPVDSAIHLLSNWDLGFGICNPSSTDKEFTIQYLEYRIHSVKSKTVLGYFILSEQLSPSINIKILYADLHTFPWKTSWENLRSKHFHWSAHFINSHNPVSWLYIDIVRRKLMLVTFGTNGLRIGSLSQDSLKLY